MTLSLLFHDKPCSFACCILSALDEAMIPSLEWQRNEYRKSFVVAGEEHDDAWNDDDMAHRLFHGEVRRHSVMGVVDRRLKLVAPRRIRLMIRDCPNQSKCGKFRNERFNWFRGDEHWESVIKRYSRTVALDTHRSFSDFFAWMKIAVS